MKGIYKFLIVVGVIFLILFLFSFKKTAAEPVYGVSFSKFHSDELKLDWKKVFLAILDDLKVRNLRLSAHWPDTEPADGKFDFSALDFQIQEAQRRGASVILAVGRRLPGWPECHEPEWLKNQAETLCASSLCIDREKEINSFKQQKLLEYIEAVASRYKGFRNIKYWQVENEPFLGLFGRFACGSFDKDFFEKELALVKKIDPSRPILITESGELSTWHEAYKYGDTIGTSLYLYIWDPHRGPFKYPNIPALFRIKQNLAHLIYGIFYGKKQIIVTELSTEPWLLQPIVDTPLKTQLERMDIVKFNEMIDYGRKTGFDTFYLWGAEWWYWMRDRGHPEFWERARELFK